VEKCRKKAQALTLEKIGKEITICGKCFEVCPYTIKNMCKK
jgi:epoxyqueuosine reductase QueG